MGIMNIFGKKTPPPIEKEPQIKRSLLKGDDGKFISKKKKVRKAIKKKVKARAAAAPITAAPITVTFFGREIRKVYDGKKWYFAVDNILSLATPSTLDGEVQRKDTFEEVFKKVTTTIDNISWADADGCIKLIREVEGVFPGPLPRWLTESSQLPYEAPLKVKEVVIKGETPTLNPSDRDM